MMPPDPELVAAAMPWARRVARGYRSHLRRRGCRVPLDELVSAAYLGLADAARRYDPRAGVAFHVFAEARVGGAMLDWLRAWLPMSRAHSQAVRDGRERDVVVLHFGALKMFGGTKSLDLQDGRSADPFEQLDCADLVRVLLRTLPPLWRELVRLHDLEGRSLKAAAVHVGRVAPWASVLHARALRRLREEWRLREVGRWP